MSNRNIEQQGLTQNILTSNEAKGQQETHMVVSKSEKLCPPREPRDYKSELKGVTLSVVKDQGQMQATYPTFQQESDLFPFLQDFKLEQNDFLSR